MKKPIIGISLDFESSGGYSRYPWYALRCHYFEAVANAGGVPLGIPYHQDLIDNFLDTLHGLIIPGGNFDIPPARYGASYQHEKVILKENRFKFDEALLQKALERDLPFLGICAGAQLLNIFFGGTLYQHIPDEIENALDHEQKHCRTQTSHEIKIDPHSLLYELSGCSSALVNSTHHQAIKELGQSIKATAWAPDGVIEAIEIPSRRFCLGIEWHPEYEITNLDQQIFQQLIKEAQTV